MFTGRLVGIYTTAEAAKPLEPSTEIGATSGVGLDGDRYSTAVGTYSNRPGPHRQVTFIEREVIANVNDESGVELAESETRRNLVTEGVPLLHLIGRTFRVGEVVFRGIKSAPPCAPRSRTAVVCARRSSREARSGSATRSPPCQDERMDFDHRRYALVLARGRAVNGLVLLVLPGIVGRLIFGTAGREPTTRALLRLVGVRDLVLGIGAITTLKERTMDAEWVGMGAVADAVDGVVSFVTPGLAARARLVAVAGGAAAVVGLLASRALADERSISLSEVDS